MSHNPAWIPLHWTLTKSCVHSELSQARAGSCFSTSERRTRFSSLCHPAILASVSILIFPILAQLFVANTRKLRDAAQCFCQEGIPAQLPMGTFLVLRLQQWLPSADSEGQQNLKGSLREGQVRNTGSAPTDTAGIWRVPQSGTWRNSLFQHLEKRASKEEHVIHVLMEVSSLCG